MSSSCLYFMKKQFSNESKQHQTTKRSNIKQQKEHLTLEKNLIVGGRLQMNNRERTNAVLHYQETDRIPVVHFGFWDETLEKWYEEGHITKEEMLHCGDGNQYDDSIGEKLGFDYNWNTCFQADVGLRPVFEEKVIEHLPDGGRKFLNSDGVVILQKDGAGSIPAEFDHTLKDRESWEKEYKPRLQFSKDRIDLEKLKQEREANKDRPYGLHCGSLFGSIRNWMGVEGISYLLADDEDLYDEIIDVTGNLQYEIVKEVLKSGVKFDFAHFWEDICFKNGPLVIPNVFQEKVGPYYQKITELLSDNGIDIVSLDCDGLIDSLIPTWLENGVNTMFPIEYGTWEGTLEPWREKYGTQIRGVGGMNKNVFAKSKEELDKEIERLEKLIHMGGYIPCPDHRIPPDAKWDNVRYYCERLRNIR